MKIPKILPQFTGITALAIVSGAQIAKLYLIKNGRMEQIHVLEEPKPAYSDREAYFAQSGRGQSYGSGSVYEPQNTTRQRQFLRHLSKDVKHVQEKVNSDITYVFAPPYMLTSVEESLPSGVRKHIAKSTPANLVNEHPLVILARITGV